MKRRGFLHLFLLAVLFLVGGIIFIVYSGYGSVYVSPVKEEIDLISNKVLEVFNEEEQNTVSEVELEKEIIEEDNKIEEISSEKTITGRLEILHYDDFDNPKNSLFVYYLKSQGKAYQLNSFQEQSDIKGGDIIEVSGFLEQENELNVVNVEKINSADFEDNQIEEMSSESEGNFGVQETLVLVVRFSDYPDYEQYTTDDVENAVFNSEDEESLQSYYDEVSYSQASFDGDVYGWLTMEMDSENCSVYYESQDRYITNGGGIFDAAIDVADPLIDFSAVNYSRIILVYSLVEECNGGDGLGTVGTSYVDTDEGEFQASISWVGADDISDVRERYVMRHEMGHNFGVSHANTLDCGDLSFGNDCESLEYGDPNDVMGYSTGHPNSIHKEIIGWLGEENFITYENQAEVISLIKPLEYNSNNIKAIKVPLEDSRNIYLEYRTAFGFDSELNNLDGAFLIINGYDSGGDSHLLDMTPADSNIDAVLREGEVYYDEEIDT